VEELEARVLELLLRSGTYVSGEEAARALGTSRATVSRLVRSLMRRGFPIEVHPGLGYRALNPDDLSLAPQVVQYLDTGVRFAVHYVESCGSTQDLADALAREGSPEGTVVLAEAMERGRGRMGRRWVAGRGGLWVTVVLRPRLTGVTHLLSLATGVAVARAIREVAGVGAGVKWPNDVLIEGRKVAGVLIEGRAEADRLQYVLVGVGVNVNNELPEELSTTATTLARVVGRPVPRLPLLASLLRNLDHLYGALSRGGVGYVLDEWRRVSTTLGTVVRAVTIDGEVVGVAEDVAEDGALLVRTFSGTVRRVYAGDVVHLRPLR
jgi:BirA family biotin operon repressor/biotin-[acetyl-CoA-carboxylase] ligase